MQNQEKKNKFRRTVIYICGVAIVIFAASTAYYVSYDGSSKSVILFGLLLVDILCSVLMITFMNFCISLARYHMIEIGPSPVIVKGNLISKIIILIALGFFILAALMAIFWL